MIKLKQSQQGVTLMSIAFYLGLLAFVVMTTLKLFPVYMESLTIESSVQGLEDDKNAEYMGVLSVRKALLKRFGINNVTIVTKDDISVVREDQTYLVDVNYEVRIPYMANIELVLTFENHGEVAAR